MKTQNFLVLEDEEREKIGNAISILVAIEQKIEQGNGIPNSDLDLVKILYSSTKSILTNLKENKEIDKHVEITNSLFEKKKSEYNSKEEKKTKKN